MNIIQQIESELGKPDGTLPRINVGDDVEVGSGEGALATSVATSSVAAFSEALSGA